MNKSGQFMTRQKHQAFTIVELLVVIVIIGILAAITIISYSGISNKAIVAGLQNDLDSNAKLLKMYNVEYGYYPNSINSSTYCPDNPTPDSRYCLKAMSGAMLSYDGGGQYFLLVDKHTTSGISYMITENNISQPYLSSFINVSMGDDHACGINYVNNVYCWGDNRFGQIGNNSYTNSLIPVAVNKTGVLNGLTIKEISTGGSHTCVIASDDNAYCWGYNSTGQLGNNSTTNSPVPVAVDRTGSLNGLSIIHIASGAYHTCVIASDNNAYCWGAGSRLGNNSAANKYVPTPIYTGGVLSGLTIKAISTGNSHSCVIASNDNAYCWGQNPYGQLGDNGTGDSLVPVSVYKTGALNGLTIKSISASRLRHTCAIASDNNAYCWGLGNDGQLGNNASSIQHAPVKIYMSGILNGLFIKSISGGSVHTCAIASDDNVYCWGDNSVGHLGDNGSINSNIPVAIYKPSEISGAAIKNLSVGYETSCIITINLKTYCWGSNVNGTIGNNTNINSIIPIITNNPR